MAQEANWFLPLLVSFATTRPIHTPVSFIATQLRYRNITIRIYTQQHNDL